MKAVGYVRVSTEEQANEGISMDAQEAAVRAYVAMRGMDLVEIIVDAGVSAGKPLSSRDGGRKVLEMVRTGKATAIIAYKLDRLFRDTSDCLTVTATWDKAGVGLHLVDLGGQAVDTTTAMGRFFLTIMAGVGEMERNLIRERTSSAMQRMRETGKYTGGNAPYGWRLSEDGENLTSHEGEQEIIRHAQELREAGLSLAKVGKALESEGLLPRSGGQWHSKTVRDLLKAKVA